MPARRLRAVLHAAHHTAPDPNTHPDSHLLGRFLDRRDEAAFAALVRRHGPAVFAACRLAGLNPSDHDDVFQAAFLALVRQAGGIRDGKSVGGWLFRTATRIARKVRARTGRTAELTDAVPGRTPPTPDADTHRVLDEEVARLPEKYRLAVALVYLAGRNTTQAAAELGWAKGTVLTRLAWARNRLRAQLLRRGVTFTVGATVVVSPGVVAGVVRVCSQFLAGGVPAGVSVAAVELSKGVVQDMTLTKLKWAAGVLLVAVALTGVGLGRWGSGEANAQPDAKKSEAKKKDKKAKPPAAEPLPLPPMPTSAPEPERPVSQSAPRLPAMMPVTSDLPPAEPKAKPAAGFTVTKPLGTWVREVVAEDDTARITLKIEDDRLKLTAEVASKKEKLTAVVEADYAINGESTAFGVISGIDLSGLSDGDGEVANVLTGQPFAFRYRVADGHLTVKEFKGLGVGVVSKMDNEVSRVVAMLCGRYVEIDPAKPNARPVPKAVIKPASGRDGPQYFPPPTVAPDGPPVGEPLLPPQPTQRRSENQPSHPTPERIHGGIMKAEPPTDREVLAAVNTKRVAGKAEAQDEFQNDITIVKNLVVNKIDPPRVFPVVGQAQLHHAHWECAVCSRDAVTQKPKVDVVFVDKDKLHAHIDGK